MEIDTTIPAFLDRRLSKKDRDAAWTAVPNKPVPVPRVVEIKPNADEVSRQRYALFKERKRSKSRMYRERSKARAADKEAVEAGMVWDVQRGGWRDPSKKKRPRRPRPGRLSGPATNRTSIPARRIKA